MPSSLKYTCLCEVVTYTNKIYCVISPDTHMDCGTDNIIYLVSCKKCGVQYVGETGQIFKKKVKQS